MGLERGIVLRSRGETGAPVPGAGTFGLWLFVASLAVFFAAALVGYTVVRVRADTWPPAGGPALPAGLHLGTLVILAGSLAIQLALVRVRRGDERGMRSGLLATDALAVAFLAVQSWNWLVLVRQEVTETSDLYGFTFFVLTGLHTVHLLGGMIGLGVVTWRAFRNVYSWAHYPGVKHAAIYWHFLGAVWLAMYALLTLSY